jgi:hypothetical protein
MTVKKQQFTRGITLRPDDVAFEGISGELKVALTSQRLQVYLNGAAREVVTTDQTQAFTNKTFDANATGNVLSNVETADLASGVLNTSTTLASASDTQVPSALAVKTYADTVGSTAQTNLNNHLNDTTDAHDASAISNVPAGSIVATDAQAAINELDGDIQGHINDAADAHDASAISNVPAGNLAATDVQGALNELQGDIDTNASGLANHLSDATDAHDASAISVVPTGNLAASDVQAALQELQGDADTASSHIAASTNVHGLSGGAAVVGTTSSQTLTNKTVTGADIRTPVRSDVKQDTKANLVTYALTASNGQLCFATDTKEMFQVVDSTLKTVGGGGVANINALLTQTFDASALSDFTQTGLELVTANMINGVQSARLIHQAGSSRSFKQTIAVDRKYRSEPVQLSLQVRSSASNGNLTLLVTDETNAATIAASQSISTASQIIASLVTNATTTVSGFSNSVINSLSVGMTVTGSGIPTGTVVNAVNTAALTITLSQAATASATVSLSFSALPDRRVFSFTIPASCASMSYTITALQEANAPESYIDDVVIELSSTALLSTSVDVPNLTAWQGYTPVFQGFGTPTAVEFEWRQVGEDVEIRGKFVSGTSTAVEARVGLPAGLTSAGTGLIPSIQNIGVWSRGAAVTNHGGIVLIQPAVSYLNFSEANVFSSTTANANVAAVGTSMINPGESFSFFAKVPCAGLSAISTKTIPLTQSGLVQGSDSVLIAAGNAAQSITAAVTNIPFNFVSNIGSAITYSGSSFTVSEAGVYEIATGVFYTTSISRYLAFYENGVFTVSMCSAQSQTLYAGSITRYLVPGVTYSIRTNDGGGTLSNTSTVHHLTVTKQSSLKQVSVNPNSKITIPTSELRFEGASTRGSTATAIVRFDSVAKIRGDAFTVVSDAVNGTAITMTKAGRLAVASSFAANISTIYISRNQAVLTAVPTGTESLAAQSVDSNGNFASLSAQFDVGVGDVIRISCSQAPTANVNNNLNLSFQEQDIAVSVTNVLPQFSESDSSVRVTGSNGYGSSGTAVRRFSNVETNIGSDIEYVDSATNGASFTIKSAGIYHVSFTNYFNQSVVSANSGISKNASSLSTGITSLSSTETLAISSDLVNTASTGPRLINAMWSGYLSVGDIIRPHADGTTGTSVNASFTMSKVGKPNVTGVDVTPFVNIPQPDSQAIYASTGNGFGSTNTQVRRFSSVSNSGNSILRYEDSPTLGASFTALKSCVVNVSYSEEHTGASASVFGPTLNSTTTGYLGVSQVEPGAGRLTTSANVQLNAGDVLRAVVEAGARHVSSSTLVRFSITATALSDQILTAPETFSTDTASLTYASSAAYTLATLNTAPVGTFITFTYAINTNTRTQTTTAPTQTTADMNTNGIQLFTRAYNAASTAGNPTYIAIQIGKGLKGRTLDLYKTSGKSAVTCNMDYWTESVSAFGARTKEYNESTGILQIDLGTHAATITSTTMLCSDQTTTTSGYLVINAGKNPALVGVPLLQPRIATISDVKSNGTGGGTATSGSYQTRTLNTLSDPTGIVTSLASNQWVLSKGEYYIEGSAPAYWCEGHKAKIRNITDSTDVILGSAEYIRSSGGAANSAQTQTRSVFSGTVVISSSKVFELQHQVTLTVATQGYGIAAGIGDSEVYSIVKITRVRD